LLVASRNKGRYLNVCEAILYRQGLNVCEAAEYAFAAGIIACGTY
jgi:hypothetical protein